MHTLARAYTYMYTHAHTCTHLHCVYTCTHMCMCTRVCTHTYARAHIHVHYTRGHIHVHYTRGLTYIRTRVCTLTYARAHRHACALHTCGLTYIHTRVCTHTQSAHILSRGWPSPQLTPEMLQSSARVPAEMGSSPSGVFVSRAPSVGTRALGRAGQGAWLSWIPEAKGSSLLPPFTHPAFMRLCESSAWQTGCGRDGQRERQAPDEAKINGQSWAVMRTQGRKAQGV